MGAAAAPLVAGSSILSAVGQYTSGEITKDESKVSAKQEGLAATQREVDRKERLLQALSASAASAGARGIAAYEGSPLAILEADIEREAEATQRDKFMSTLAQKTIRARGKVAQKQARLGAATSLLSGGAQAAYYMPTGGAADTFARTTSGGGAQGGGSRRYSRKGG